MPTPTTRDAKQALYAVAGVADLAVSTIRHLPADAARLRDRLPDEAVKTYGDLVRRGESLVTGVRRSRPTRQAAEATRTAVSVSQLTWSASSVRISARSASRWSAADVVGLLAPPAASTAAGGA